MCDLYKFFVHVAYGRGQSSSGRVTKSQGKGQFWGFSSPLPMHCSMFAANNVTQQKGSFHRRQEGVMGVHSTIYDCLVGVL